MILRLVQKRFLGPAKKKKDGILLVFKKRDWRSFFAFTSRRFAVYISLYL
jgi:hypothetical protein